MAIDTNNKKLALIHLRQPYQPSPPASADGLGQDDKQQLLWEYPGISWGAPPASTVAIEVIGIYYRQLLAGGRRL